MTKFKAEQEVVIYSDEDISVIQEITLDTEDNGGWIQATHNNETLSMSIENWEKLVNMTNKLINKVNALQS